jgi:hypothetical protein
MELVSMGLVLYNNNMEIKITDSTKGLIGMVKLTYRNVITGEEDVYHIFNVVCHSGKSSIARRLANAEAGYGKITYCATGTGAGTPSNVDIKMFTELFRKTISVVSYNSNVVTFTIFFSTTESNGVLTEIGLFGDAATATADSGTMYAHTNIIKTKALTDTLTIEWSLVIQ